MTKPNCHNRPDYLDTVTVQDGWSDEVITTCHGMTNRSRVSIMKIIQNPMSKGCQQHSPHGAATLYGWDCAGCRHLPERKKP